MKNSLLQIPEHWEILRDAFYEIDPLDESIDEKKKSVYLYDQEDLLWIKRDDYNLDLGWYGNENEGFFGLYLYKGTDWHNCQLLEKRQIKVYKQIIEIINNLIDQVDSGSYKSLKIDIGSIDDYSECKNVSVLNIQIKN